MQDNLSEKLANAAKKILGHCDDAMLGKELKNGEVLRSVINFTDAHESVKAHFGDPRVTLRVSSEFGDTSIAEDGSVFQSVRLSVDVIFPNVVLNHVEALCHVNLLNDVTTLAAELEEALDGPTWVLKMSAEEASAKRIADARAANETLASAILHTTEAKEALKRIKVGETRVVEHPSVRLLERSSQTWEVQLPNGKAYSVRGMQDYGSVWVTRSA